MESSQALPVSIAVSPQLSGKKKGTGKDDVANLCICHCVGWVWQECCRGDLREKRLGAAWRWTQPASVSSPVDTHTQLSPSGESGIPLWKGRKHWTSRGGGGEKSEKQQRKHQGQGRRFFVHQSRYSPAAHGEDHARAHGYSSSNWSP